jgi:hypothetical protein
MKDPRFFTALNPRCPGLQGRARVPRNLALFSVGGYGDVPRETAIVCVGCKKELGLSYKKHGGTTAYKFCYKEYGTNHEANCVGISAYLPSPHTLALFLHYLTSTYVPLPHSHANAVSEDTYVYICNNFDALLEQSKDLNSREEANGGAVAPSPGAARAAAAARALAARAASGSS